MLLGVIFLADFPVETNTVLIILFTVIFSVTHVEVLHRKMLRTDKDYRVDVLDERNIAIKEKAGNITNMLTLALLGLATLVFIELDYIVPAIVLVQPIRLIISSNFIEKKM